MEKIVGFDVFYGHNISACAGKGYKNRAGRLLRVLKRFSPIPRLDLGKLVILFL